YGRGLYYWKGRNHIRFLKKNYTERILIALLRLLVKTDGEPAPLWKIMIHAVRFRSPLELWILKGYLGGLIKE
ncbi:MAG: hypothetical protein ABEJ98_03865, partial [Candidatus Nanohaloarchaea archaeon]